MCVCVCVCLSLYFVLFTLCVWRGRLTLVHTQTNACTHTHIGMHSQCFGSVMLNEVWNEESEMLEHSFPREHLQQTNTVQVKLDQGGQSQTFNLTTLALPLLGRVDLYQLWPSLNEGYEDALTPGRLFLTLPQHECTSPPRIPSVLPLHQPCRHMHCFVTTVAAQWRTTQRTWLSLYWLCGCRVILFIENHHCHWRHWL